MCIMEDIEKIKCSELKVFSPSIDNIIKTRKFIEESTGVQIEIVDQFRAKTIRIIRTVHNIQKAKIREAEDDVRESRLKKIIKTPVIVSKVRDTDVKRNETFKAEAEFCGSGLTVEWFLKGRKLSEVS